MVAPYKYYVPAESKEVSRGGGRRIISHVLCQGGQDMTTERSENCYGNSLANHHSDNNPLAHRFLKNYINKNQLVLIQKTWESKWSTYWVAGLWLSLKGLILSGVVQLQVLIEHRDWLQSFRKRVLDLMGQVSKRRNLVFVLALVSRLASHVIKIIPRVTSVPLLLVLRKFGDNIARSKGFSFFFFFFNI
jgi:hypothetical protein